MDRTYSRCHAADRMVDWQMWVHGNRCRTAGINQAGEQADAGSRVARQAEVSSGQVAEVSRAESGLGQGWYQVSREGTGMVGKRQSQVTSWVSNKVSGTSRVKQVGYTQEETQDQVTDGRS